MQGEHDVDNKEYNSEQCPVLPVFPPSPEEITQKQDQYRVEIIPQGHGLPRSYGKLVPGGKLEGNCQLKKVFRKGITGQEHPVRQRVIFVFQLIAEPRLLGGY